MPYHPDSIIMLDVAEINFTFSSTVPSRWHRASTGEIWVPTNTKWLSVQFYPIENVKSARYYPVHLTKLCNGK